jgi:hypothetical protein
MGYVDQLWERWRHWRLRRHDEFMSEEWLRDCARRSGREPYCGPRWRWPVIGGRVEAQLEITPPPRSGDPEGPSSTSHMA